MKVYQELWCRRLVKIDSWKYLYRLCREIEKDDTGHTDALPQLLAIKIVMLLRDNKSLT